MKVGYHHIDAIVECNSFRELVRTAMEKVEEGDVPVPDGFVVMVGFSRRDGKWLIETISSWQESIVEQVWTESKYFDSLQNLDESIMLEGDDLQEYLSNIEEG